METKCQISTCHAAHLARQKRCVTTQQIAANTAASKEKEHKKRDGIINEIPHLFSCSDLSV